MNPRADKVISLRRELHRHPEISGRESETAGRIAEFFADLSPDETLEGLGGNGLAFVFAGSRPGPTVMLRCELDAVPVEETGAVPWRSLSRGRSHACGHDGHMAIQAAVGMRLADRRPARGRAVLLYQPAEENGQGAAAVIEDPRLASMEPDWVFALHNLPGFPMGTVVVRPGTFSCASRGMVVKLGGRTAHAAQPETGRSPAVAMCRIMDGFTAMAPGMDPREADTFATVVGARLGCEDAFGTAPGRAEIRITLRSATDEAMRRLVARAEAIVTSVAAPEQLATDISYRDIFPATVNNPEAARIIQRAVGREPVAITERPFRWSEDFGRLTTRFRGALFGIGAGRKVPALHSPDYDFPDALIEPATTVLQNILQAHLF